MKSSHTAKQNTCRRGIAVFYSAKIKYRLTKDFVSKKFDIMWLRLKLEHKDQIYCFFYAPGANHPDDEITLFYDDLRLGFGRYSNLEIFMMGDSNARLGSFSQDVNIHGRLVANKNKPHFMGFLSFSGLKYPTGVFCKGTPTYEILGKRRSIIDVCLTNALNQIKDFEVLST